jgi:hypothetical protein
MRSRRPRHDPWSRLQRQMTDDGRRDLLLALVCSQLLEEGKDRATVLTTLRLSDAEASALAARIRAAMSLARLELDPSSRIAAALRLLAESGTN